VLQRESPHSVAGEDGLSPDLTPDKVLMVPK
jgi:hypothetical protein